VVHGVSKGLGSPRKEIEWLGDSVVPAQAEVVGWVIRELMAAELLQKKARLRK